MGLGSRPRSPRREAYQPSEPASDRWPSRLAEHYGEVPSRWREHVGLGAPQNRRTSRGVNFNVTSQQTGILIDTAGDAETRPVNASIQYIIKF